MRLKHIKLVGFKSFVDATKVPFPDQMTCVVGPNGCGKSNVIDAVRWVLGESSAKNLRGDAMTDVIFNGSTARKPVSQASVELVFDNSLGRIQGEYANYAEISVKRQVTRDGQSNYFLNSQRCRRRDITDLFLGTGLGPRSYAIIEQGMISRLIESKPQELRVFIEEAAGISKYKERRKETENRIRHTRENLERLTDVRDELGQQLEKLQRQAAAAVRYKALKQEQRQKQGELTALRWLHQQEHAQRLRADLADQQAQLEQAIAEQRKGELGTTEFREQAETFKQRIEDLQQQLFTVSNQLTRHEQQLQHQRQWRQQYQQRLQQLQQEQQQLREQTEEDRLAAEQHQQQVAEHQPQVEQLAERLAAAEEALESIELRWQQQQQQREQWQQQLHQLQRDKDRCDNEQQQIRQALQYSEQQLQQTAEHLSQLKQENAALEDPQQQRDYQQLQQQYQQQQQQLAECQQQLQELDQQLDSVAQQRDETAQQLHQQQGQLAATEQLLAQGQGDDSAAQQWLQQQHIPTLLSELTVEPEWRNALESVCHGWLNAGLVDNWPQTFAEVAGLMLIRADASATAPEWSLAAKVSGKAQRWQWLQQIYCVAQLDSGAAQIFAEQPQVMCVLTPSGQQLWRDRYRMQAQDSGEGLLQLKARQQQLQHSIGQLQQRIDTLQQQRQQALQQRQQIQQQHQQRQATVQQQQQQLAEVEAQYHYLQKQQQQNQLQQQRLLEQQQQLQQQKANQQEQLEQLSERAETLQFAYEECQQHPVETDDMEQQRQQHRSQVQQAQQQLQTAQLALQQAQSEARQAQQLAQRAQQREQQVTEQLLALQQQQDPQAEDDEALAEKLEQGLAQRAELEQQITEQREQLSEVEAKIQELSQGHSGLSQRIERQRGQVESLRIEMATIDERLQTLVESLQNDRHSLKTLLEEMPEQAEEHRWQADLEQIQQKIQRLGAINLAAIEEAEAQQTRKAYLDEQNEDLQAALETLENAIKKIDRETRQRFKATYDAVNNDLQQLFPKVFGGGSASLELTDDDLLETGVTIMARPPGKKNSTIHLLSGGEKALTALSLVFAIFRLNPAPFCLLDEVDAPLDDANVGRFCRLVKEMSETVQFIYISHNKVAMEMASHLAGVTMQEAGVSRLVAVDIDAAVAMTESA
ncbi:chromosome segregation protein SMC [Idiomarina tyrosinivorans]|uniref:Chromosome partition protein Smc n=1 Tax=Idiomarina tyrosinivorans TaxID=1445662 RepID=A0A432ZLV3_9GAMM|nr:chromosome segregation protein SMC [Idiomarina tyrosinivorans]RUO78890.1 chromosome segregation protein SMC [Idiomarina tyrosinivorans]